MLQTILVPLDGSSLAEQGLSTACRLARETHATLSLVRGVRYPTMEPKIQEADHLSLRHAREYLSTVRDRLAGEGFTVRFDVVPCDPVGAILFAADMQNADLISICTHGTGGLRQVLVGSVAEAVLRRSETPILLTRGMDEPTLQASTPFRRILVPIDGTPFAEAALSYLTSEHIGDDAELILLRVVAPATPPYLPGLTGEAAALLYNDAHRETQKRLLDAEAYLDAMGASAHRKGAWRTRTALGGAAPEILAAVRSENADLIVLVSHGRHGLERLLNGSVARELLHHAEVPLLILPGEVARATAPGDLTAIRLTV